MLQIQVNPAYECVPLSSFQKIPLSISFIMDSDPKNLDGSDAPSSKQARPPPRYAKFKESVKGALLLLARLDQASLAMLKHDEEYRHAVQTFLAPISSTPISEIFEQAMKSGLDAIVSHISTHLPTSRNTHPKPQISPSTRQLSTATAQSSFKAPFGDGESLPSTVVSSSPGVFGAPGVPQSLIPLIPGRSQPRLTTTKTVKGLIQAISRQDRDKAAITVRQRRPLPINSQDTSMVSVYVIRLVWRTWSRQNPTNGLASYLNAKMDEIRRRRKMDSSSSLGLQFGGGPAAPPLFESQDRIIKAFMGQDVRTIVLVCPCQTSPAGEQALLLDLQGLIDEVYYDLVRPWGGLKTELYTSSIKRDLVMSIF